MNALSGLDTTAGHDGIIAVAILLGVIVVSLLIQKIVFAFFERLLRDNNEGVFASLLRRAQAPAGFAIPLLGALIALPELRFPPNVDAALVKRRYKLDVEDNLRARQVETCSLRWRYRFVVVRIWDNRRMLLPLTYFSEKTVPKRDAHRRGAARQRVLICRLYAPGRRTARAVTESARGRGQMGRRRAGRASHGFHGAGRRDSRAGQRAQRR